jgi:hypothetical protein
VTSRAIWRLNEYGRRLTRSCRMVVIPIPSAAEKLCSPLAVSDDDEERRRDCLTRHPAATTFGGARPNESRCSVPVHRSSRLGGGAPSATAGLMLRRLAVISEAITGQLRARRVDHAALQSGFRDFVHFLPIMASCRCFTWTMCSSASAASSTIFGAPSTQDGNVRDPGHRRHCLFIKT